MDGEQRRRTIAHWVREHGGLTVLEFAEQHGVSPEAVRSDLAALEHQGTLRRVPDGAVPVVPVQPAARAPSTAPGRCRMHAEKERIARAAVGEVPDGGSILLDAGSTVAQLAGLLPAGRDLTIVTQSLAVAVALSDRPDLDLMLIGGRVRGCSLALVDSWALRTLAGTRVDVAFLGADGVSVRHGMTVRDGAAAMVKRAAMVAAQRTVLLADHTKLDQDRLASFGSLAEVDILITDDGADPERVGAITAAGPRVVVV
ncbi:DeoR/GlpR transcriptional regulator [Amycolatopsis balhimycina DSM 5908]|uniref:Lactose phosphotransferase system repressor n=1 Tax=Amycolatopsis balhimycina DSM 5908 TaxID=1081091 RepID=A0A428VXV9_AMYBA|nr:DeoR/GlpR family DNA-binding transcription regulator [Amycolatopsis balhimycina]RSM35693.1 DeoR/GlpR transcriptional regulator [Amycolatopsis balhimycina DSM 5908]